MATPENDPPTDDVTVGALIRRLVDVRTIIWRVTAVVVLIAGVIGTAYFFQQPVRWMATVGFRPVFYKSEGGEYPNGLKFATTDIVDSSVADEVFEKNGLKDYCTLEAFRGALTVENTSPMLQFLDLEFQARLSDIRLSLMERNRIQDEYAARRQSLPIQYRLRFVRPDQCRLIPTAVAYKTLTDMLQTWADNSEKKRGVLSIQRNVLTPGIFDFKTINNSSLLVRSDLVRTALTRVIANVMSIEILPGSTVARLSSNGVSFLEIRSKIEDLVRAELDPLIAVAGRGAGPDSVYWVTQALQVAITKHKLSQDRADAYNKALREYSGLANAPAPGSGPRPSGQNPTDVQSLTPQIEGTFIDRIVAMSDKNIVYRQDLTTKMVNLQMEAVRMDADVEHYRQLLDAVRAPGGPQMTPDEIARRLDAITESGKALTLEYDRLYEEFSKISLKAGPELYRIEEMVSSTSVRAFGLRDLFLLVVTAALMAAVLTAAGVLFRDRWRVWTAVPRPRPSALEGE